jgi:hypothetical protein
MKKFIFFFIIFICFFNFSCEKEYEPLVEAKKISENQYLIICRGLPKKGLSNKVQQSGTAKESALLYAQYYAKQKLGNIDPASGTIQSYEFNGEYGTIYYLIEKENIDNYIK